MVFGGPALAKEISVIGSDNEPEKWKKGSQYPAQQNYALCRCGKSSNKPFCDGTHLKAGFKGTETASRKSFMEMSEIISGPGLNLHDCKCYCSIARFCHRAGDAWTLTERSDDPVSKQTAVEEACNCPSGRLVAYDKTTNEPIETAFQPSISLIEDTKHNVSGPLWIKGGIPVESADGYQYEVRNRVALCRCGKSGYKPFCNGAHIKAGFNDGDASTKK
ncbi:MAG: CDGSH iron-sulfur domain-containing protein [Candidatus Saganbacteria bacterium]|nr:CDGSH iron-sulfur domain-containing protein [Candidatus Saganbacteria bacterium]